MAWDGYFTYAGTEIINVARTECYAANAGAGWLRPVYENKALPYMLNETYRSPLLDDAPWVDPDIPESLDFLGVYPLEITGVEDSTRTSVVTEALGNGGSVGSLRFGTRQMAFSALILATTEAAADYGLRWLNSVLDAGVGGSICDGEELSYLTSAPEIIEDGPGLVYALFEGGGAVDTPGRLLVEGGTATITDKANDYYGGDALHTGAVVPLGPPFGTMPPPVDLSDCFSHLERTVYRVLFNSGPTVASKRVTVSGGQVWSVAFTAVAGDPYSVGAEQRVIEGFMDPAIVVPWADGVVPDGGTFDLDGFIYPDSDCVQPIYSPLYDPLSPALIPPPGPPTVPLGYYSPPTNWRRRQFTIPKQYVPTWGEVVPKISIHAITADLRNLRIRFYSDPYGQGDISNDPCAYCGDIIVSYLPTDHDMIIDGTRQTITVIGPGGESRRADSLVFRTDGTPFSWPALTCGHGYVVTLDLPQTQPPPTVDLSLYPRSN